MRVLRWSIVPVVAALGIAGLVTLGESREKDQPSAPPPPQVSVLTVRRQTIPTQYEWVAQAAASNSAQVRSQVSGVIVERSFVEGTDVRKGAVLYRIDPRTYAANYASARARLAENEAVFANAERTLNRLKPLLAQQAVAQQDVDNAQAAYDQARAAVLDAKAAVSAAKKNYDDTFVRAEVGGRVGRALMDVGSLTSGASDLLTTIDRVDPIYVYFNPSDQDVLQWRRDVASRRLVLPGGVLDVQATLADGSVLGTTGKLDFVALTLQSASTAAMISGGAQRATAAATDGPRVLRAGSSAASDIAIMPGKLPAARRPTLARPCSPDRGGARACPGCRTGRT